MKKNILIIGVILLVVLLVGVLTITKKQPPSQNLESTPKQVEKEITEKEIIKNENILSYPGAVVDKDKCGEDAFYVSEKSADFVKNYCNFLKEKGWKLVHQDYSDCDEIKSFGGGYNYEKGSEKISISVIRYGENATCFWVYKK